MFKTCLVIHFKAALGRCQKARVVMVELRAKHNRILSEQLASSLKTCEDNHEKNDYDITKKAIYSV